VTLQYDANGNLTGDGTWAYLYDAENRLKSATQNGAAVASYAYDPLGRRQAKLVGGVTTSFLSDGDEEIAEYDGAGGLLRRYVPGPGTDQPIAMVTPSGGSNTRAYFHANRQGSTVAMSNDAGTMSEGPYTYDAYGNGAPLTGVPFKYTGRRLDPETGLYYYRARYYSANLGRFLQTDPVGYSDQMNLYAYVGNDPLNLVDPTGTYGRGYGWGDKQWQKFDKLQQKTAGDMEDKARKERAGAAEMDKIGRHDMSERARTRASNLEKGAADLRGTDKSANLVSESAFRKFNAGEGAVAGVLPSGTGIIINRDSAPFRDYENGNSLGTGRVQFYLGHESLHTGAGLVDQRWSGNGEKAYKFGFAPQREAYSALPQRQQDINPDHLMDLVY